MLEKVSEQGREEKMGQRLIERMKEERVNRKDGALEETDKDLREQMRGVGWWQGGGVDEPRKEKQWREKERKGEGGRRKMEMGRERDISRNGALSRSEK